MEKRSRTEITIKTDRVFVLSKRKRQSHGWCFDCSQPSEMLTPEEVVEATGLTSRAVYRAVETGRVHFADTPEGLILICLNSFSLLGDKTVRPDIEANRLRIVPPLASENSSEVEVGLESMFQAEIQAPDAAATGVIWKESGTQRPTHNRQGWILTPESLDKLLGRLDIDRERAGQKYENIRRKLIKYFEYRGCLSPQDQADETINRVARRISEGSEIWTVDPASYFYGVARYVLKEYWNAPERYFSPLECLSTIAHPPEPPPAIDATQSEPTTETRLQALDQCIRALSAEDHELILQYYQGEKGDKIRNRQNLAKRLGIPLNALRIKVHRIRRRLEADVNEYLKPHE